MLLDKFPAFVADDESALCSQQPTIRPSSQAAFPPQKNTLPHYRDKSTGLTSNLDGIQSPVSMEVNAELRMSVHTGYPINQTTRLHHSSSG
jgi:hypothetical protein